MNNIVQYCKKIVIPEGITTIYISAFINCRYLEEVILPETLTTLRYGAFYGCSSLKKIVIPSKVEFFGESGWISPVGGCVSLTDITFLNPECNIYTHENSIPKQTIIHGFHGSTAEEYAEKYSRTFVALD